MAKIRDTIGQHRSGPYWELITRKRTGAIIVKRFDLFIAFMYVAADALNA